MTWDDRKLASYGGIEFAYNSAGIRTSKTVGNTTYNYVLEGTRVLEMVWGDNLAQYIYDDVGSPIGMILNGDFYFFEKNLQGDILGVYTDTGTQVLAFSYDAWGNILSTSGSAVGSTIETAAIFRYRGYIYDSETGFYYLQIRFYDPNTGRFISMDSIDYLGVGDEIFSYNLYAYCFNNSVNYIDTNGMWPEKIPEIINDISTYVELGLELAIDAAMYSVKHAVRPNNISKNIFQKEINKSITSLTRGKNVLNKIGYVVAVAIVIIQVGEDVFVDMERGYSADRIASNALTNTVIYGATTALSIAAGAKIGAAIGTVLCPAVGTIVGAGIGAAAAYGADYLLKKEINGKSVIDHARDSVYFGCRDFRDGLANSFRQIFN